MRNKIIVFGGLGILLALLGVFAFQIFRYGGWVEYSHRDTILEIEPDYRGELSIFILVGQSNMSGEASLPADIRTSSKIWVFGNDYKWKIAAEPIDDSTNQVDMVSFDEAPSYSLATSFARTYRANNKDMVIGLVPCALGGSSIVRWQRSTSTDTLFGSCLQRMKIASLAGKIQGILVFQGESEANSEVIEAESNPIIDNYGVLFQQMMVDFRKDIGIDDLPIVFAQVSPAPGVEPNENWLAIQNAQASVDLDCTAMIFTTDLIQQDGLHIGRNGLNDAGERFAIEMWRLVTDDNCNP